MHRKKNSLKETRNNSINGSGTLGNSLLKGTSSNFRKGTRNNPTSPEIGPKRSRYKMIWKLIYAISFFHLPSTQII